MTMIIKSDKAQMTMIIKSDKAQMTMILKLPKQRSGRGRNLRACTVSSVPGTPLRHD